MSTTSKNTKKNTTKKTTTKITKSRDVRTESPTESMASMSINDRSSEESSTDRSEHKHEIPQESKYEEQDQEYKSPGHSTATTEPLTSSSSLQSSSFAIPLPLPPLNLAPVTQLPVADIRNARRVVPVPKARAKAKLDSDLTKPIELTGESVFCDPAEIQAAKKALRAHFEAEYGSDLNADQSRYINQKLFARQNELAGLENKKKQLERDVQVYTEQLKFANRFMALLAKEEVAMSKNARRQKRKQQGDTEPRQSRKKNKFIDDEAEEMAKLEEDERAPMEE